MHSNCSEKIAANGKENVCPESNKSSFACIAITEGHLQQMGKKKCQESNLKNAHFACIANCREEF